MIWLHLAAENGSSHAIGKLASYYAQGKHLIKDNVAAYKWYILGDNVKVVFHKEKQNLEKEMTEEEINSAKKQAKEWLTKLKKRL